MAEQHHLRQLLTSMFGMTAPALLLLAGCEREPDAISVTNEVAPDNISVAEQPAPALPQVPTPLPPLRRSELLAAAAAAADATASGLPLPEENAELVGRSFEIRLPFGCSGPASEDSSDWAGWSYNPEKTALKLFARPEITENWPHLRALAGEMRFDAAEGFWLRRPWTNAETCPAAAATPPATAPGLEQPLRRTLGIVRFFSPDEPRTLRRGPRPYSATIRIDKEKAAMPKQYRLLLSGRITGFPDKQPVHCWSEASDQRPTCLFAAEFSRVAFETREGRILSEWRG